MNLVGRRSIGSWPNLRHETESKVLALCNLGQLREALETLHSYRNPLASSIYSNLLQVCVDTNAKKEGKFLYDHLFARGYLPNLHLNTKFIIFFANAGELVLARNVFDGMPEPDVVSWTALISGYSQNGFLYEALDIFVLMHRWCNKANQFTYSSVIRACTATRCIRSGLQIQGCVEKSRFRQNLYVNGALVDFHLKCGMLEDAWSLFWGMEDRDVVLWNSMIGGHLVRGLADDSFKLFISMLEEGKFPDHFTFASILKACGLRKDFLNADKMHSLVIKSGCSSHYAVSGSLIDAYVKCKRMCSARLLYDSLPEQDLFSCTALITGYSTDGSFSRDALKLYCKFNQTGMKIDDVILCSMLNVSANEASLDLGRQIHACTVKNQSNHDLALHNALVDMYAKSGELQDAHLAFDEIKNKNVISWTSLITGYGKHGQGEDAVMLFNKMEDNGVKPNDVTFLSLISACSHTGLARKGMNFFDLMVNKYAIQPRSEHYSCVVDLLGREGLINEAYNFVKTMNFKPNISIWSAMLGACRIHDNKSIGEVAAGNLLAFYPQKSVNYVVLANIYAAASLWENAWKTRNLMEQKSIQKDRGCSSIYLVGNALL
ncbi:pentatricopeptide repeat-containing protein At3g20730 [Phalaenopsis equestris]|uniref:pentatricopeptide repeat-containing protein At3g20730 n=1 Tax=Phalaenopsis equestris TaxID=78828 RepID=UPI0009E4DD9E|nr:pentatricopeptide repeat-containing protein At3g20730 [Phalaenopsis equestris]